MGKSQLLDDILNLQLCVFYKEKLFIKYFII